MATKYLALLTNIGAAKLAKATALGTKVEITQLAVGDGNGVLPTPNPAQTALVHELRRAPLNMLTVDPANVSQIIAEQVIPEEVGGWWIREIGLFDKDGDMVAIANCAETYKPQLQEGSGRVQVIRVILIVSSTEAVTLKIDPAVVLATRQYVDSQLREHEQSRNHPDASTTGKGFVQLSSSVISESESQAATSKAVKIAMDNANARLAKERNLADLPNPALARQNLELGAFHTDSNFTSVSAPRGGIFFYITPSGEWGVQDSAGNPLPLPLAGGGTGANTLSGARVKLGVQHFSSDENISTVSAPTSGVFLYIANSGNWGVQDSAGNPLPLPIANGGTGANTLLGARVQLGVSQFGTSGSVSAMSSPDSSKSVILDNAGTWGAQTKEGAIIPLSVARGGTGATNPSDARAALQLGSAATKTVGTGSGQIPDMSAFLFSAVAKGYEKLPDGKIRQWGTISIPAANASTDFSFDSFAIPFPNGVLNCRVNGVQTTTNTPCFASAEAISTTQIRLKAIAIDLTNKAITQGMAVTVAWEAIGA
ncbi:phage tail protein [Enterobacter sp. DRP3]|nr:phage tail protein [Enterobacter sp. DRP3]